MAYNKRQKLEDPKQIKKKVSRGITEMVTPGIANADSYVKMQVLPSSVVLSVSEKQLISQISMDLETGNHLLGRPRPEGYWKFAAEHGAAVLALKQGATLTERQRDILLERANNLYEGLHDLALDLNIDEQRLRNALSVGSVNEHRSVEEYPITHEGNYWYVGNAIGYGIMPQYAVQVAGLYNGEQVDRDGRMMMRFVSEDDANNFVGNIRLLNDRYTNQLRDGIIEKMRKAGIAVNTDWQEGERVLVQENGRVREGKESIVDKMILSAYSLAEEIPYKILSKENWLKEFGENYIVKTPIGNVKIGEHQYDKLLLNNRGDLEFSMIKKTLVEPDFIVEEKDIKLNSEHERSSQYFFIKAFVNYKGEKFYFFKSVTVNKEGMEVNTSNHIDRESRIRKELLQGKLLWKRAEIASGLSDVEQGLYKQPGNLSEPAVQGRVHPQSIFSTAKVQQNFETAKENGGKNEKILLAPNGKPSNLSPELYEYVRTPAFKEWFGDWENNSEGASKILDENGEPKVMYHGTNVMFDEFISTNRGIWFADTLERAESYAKAKDGDIVMPVFLNIKNPAYSEYPKSELDNWTRFNKLGYDGRIVLDGDNIFNVVATDNEQVMLIDKLQHNSVKEHRVEPVGLSVAEIKERVGERLTNNTYSKVRSINPFVNFLWSEKYPSVLPFREVFPTPTMDDYFICTDANFEYIGSNLAMQPDGLLDAERENQQKWAEMVASGKYEHQKSPRSNSEYLLDRETGDIYRFSNHWGRVASCEWSLDKVYGTEDTSIYQIGKCNINDFKVNKTFSSYLADNPAYAPAYADALQKTIVNYETLLSSDVEMTDFVRNRLTDVLADYRKLFERYQQEGYKLPKYSNIRFHQELRANAGEAPVILRDAEAQRVYHEIITSGTEFSDGYPAHSGALGMFMENGKYVAFDNSTNDCWVEEFTNEGIALSWLRGELSTDEAYAQDALSSALAVSVSRQDVERAMDSNLVKRWVKAKSSNNETAMKGFMMFGFGSDLIHEFAKARLGIDNKFEPGKMFYNSWELIEDLISAAKEKGLDVAIANKYVFQFGSEDVQRITQNPENMYSEQEMEEIKKYLSPAAFEDFTAAVRSLSEAKQIQAEEERIMSYQNGDAVTKAFVLYDIAQRRLFAEHEGDERYFRQQRIWSRPDGSQGILTKAQNATADMTVGTKWVLKNDVAHELMHMIATSPITEQVPLLDMMPSAMQRYLDIPSQEDRLAALQRLTDNELDAVYFAAMPDNGAVMRDVLNIFAERRGYTLDSSYQGSLAFNGAAPSGGYYGSTEERLEAWDNEELEGAQTLGDYINHRVDIGDLDFRLNDPRGGINMSDERLDAINSINQAIHEGHGTIKMYRAVPATIEEGQFRNGDWITPSLMYAQEHVRINGWDDYRIIEQEVSVDDIWWDGNDIAEWGYDDGKDRRYKNTLNNVKSDELITRDDMGEIIPPSLRFNERSSDIRFMYVPNSQSPIFVSNAKIALDKIKQDKATPEQWLKMLEKNGGIKSGEDRWIGLSDWLRSQTDVRVLSKYDILSYINENTIRVEEVRYMDRHDYESIPRFAEYQQEFEDIAAHLDDLWADADKEYADFMERMQDKYEDWEYEMTNKEILEEGELLRNRERYTVNEADRDAYDVAFDVMVSRHDLLFGSAFGHEDGKLFVKDAFAARQILPVDHPIHDIRLDYTTKGLTNKREIALVVPTAQQYKEDDEIHFGDAGDGRAVAWVRFGEAISYRERSEDEVMQYAMSMPTAASWHELADYQPVPGYKSYYNLNGGAPSKSDSILEKDGEFHIQFKGDHAEVTFNREEDMVALRRVSGTFGSLEAAVAAYNEFITRRDHRMVPEKTLVIDEIQSKRHQDGRELGYASAFNQADLDAARQVSREYSNSLYDKYIRGQHPGEDFLDYANEEERQRFDELTSRVSSLERLERNAVPDTPFEKNWHELAMKRMLRYAAENGYDRVAWTNGLQQAERYNLGGKVESIFINHSRKDEKLYSISVFDNDAKIISSVSPDNATEEDVRNLFGKNIGDQLLQGVADLDRKKARGEVPRSEAFSTQGQNLEVGGDGMKAFYDKILPSFMNKYGKQWGIQTETIDIPAIQRDGSSFGERLHSVRVTGQMKQDVMEGQPMFFRNGEHMAYGFVHNGTIYIDPRIATAETPLHEYTHLWAEVLRQRNPQEWANIVRMMKDTPELWSYVKQNYPHLRTDDQIADEALAQFSGKRGYKKLQDFVDGKQNATTIFGKIMEVLGRFWDSVSSFFGIHYANKEEVADRVLFDLLNEVNPLDYRLTAPVVNIENPAVVNDNPFARVAADRAFFDNFYREQQEAVVESDNFKEWFGNWQVDALILEKDVRVEPIADYDTADLGGAGLQYRVISDGKVIGFIPLEGYFDFKTNSPDFLGKKEVSVVNYGFGAEIKPEYRHKGFGKAAYLAVAKELAASGHVLCSADMKNMSDDAKGLWSSLEKEGLVSFSGNRYSFNNDRLFASKIVDANGKPRVVEHGTHADFTVFDIDKIGANSRDNGLFGAGFYFATKAPAWLNDGSENYHVMKVFLDIKHPFEISDGVVDIYDEIKEKLDRAPFRGLMLTGFNGQQIPLGAYIDHIKAVDQMIAAGQHIDLMAQDEELQVYHPKDREKVWRERELSRRSGIGSLGLSWSVLINDQLGSYQFTAAAMQSGYDGVIVDRGEGYKEYVAFEPSQIKSATDNIGLYSRENNDIRYHFIGEKGALNLDLSDGGNRIDMLHHAEELEHAHSSAKDIKVVTGWERGADGLWRYEIPSLRSFNFYGNAEYLANHPEIERYRELSHREACAALGVSGFAPLSVEEQAEIKALRLNPVVRDYQYNVSMKTPGSYSLQDFIDAPQLFVAYPELKDVPVSFAMLPNGEGGNYSQDADWLGDIVDRRITINEETMAYARDLYNETAKDKVIDTFEHEIQHAIQGLEGFAQGGRPGDRITLVGSQLEKVRQELQQLESSADYQAWKDADTQYRIFQSRVPAAMQNEHPNLDAMLDLTEQERQLKRNAYMLYTVDVKHQEQRINELHDYLDNGFPLTFDNYRSLAGEVEARNVASRRHLSPALRQTMLASATEDVGREQQLISYTSRAAAYIDIPAYKDLVLVDDKAIGFVVDHEGTDIYLLNLPVHEYDRADGARQGLGGLDLDADYEGSIRFASEEDLKAFYRHYQDDIDYRQSRYRSINDIAAKQGRLAAEDYSRLVPVEYIFKPVPPMREWIDVNNDVYFQSLPAEARQRMTYFDGLSYEQWSAANGIDTTDPLGAYYFFQKYADRKDAVIDILNNGVSRDNVYTVGRQAALLSDSLAEALAFRTLLAHYDHNTNIEYYRAVQVVFDDRQRQLLAQYHPELKVVQGLDGYEVEDVKLMVEDHVKEILADQFFDDDVWIKEITVIGSRSRGEAHDGSDLDILLEYGGNDVHEDTLFNALHEEPFEIDGIPVDINPINEHYSLNTEQWLLRDARWREQDRAKQVLINEQKYMATLEQVQKVLSEVLPRDGQRLEFPRGFMADDFEHRADKQMLLVDTIKRVNDRFLVGTDREGFLDISRLSESEQAFVQKLVREQQLCELIGVGKSITYSEDSPLVLLGMDENQTATYQSVSVKNAELVFKGTLTEADGTEANINLFSLSADNMEALYSHVTMMQQRNKVLVADVADTYGEVFRLASGLKTHLDTPSPLYDQLDVLSQPVVRDADQPVSLRQWAADALLSIHGGEPEFVRLNELTNGRFEEFVSQLAEGMDDDQLSMLSSEVVSRRAVYSPAVLEEVYRDVLRHYNDGNLPESDAAREDLVELLGLVNSESLHAWAVNGDVRPGEYIQQLRSALTNVSVYDAAQAFVHVRQVDQQAERDYVANQKSPKTDIEGRYAFVMSYFLNNYQSLTAEQKAVFQQLDHADTPEALRQWASSVRVGHALADLSDIPAAVRDEVDELAYNIAEYDEDRHEELLQGFHAVGMVDDQRMSALVAISDRLHAQYPDELVLFKNGNGMSAVGQDAEQVLRLTGWPANLVYFGADNYVQLTNISSHGYEVLAEKDVNLRIVNAPVNMRPFREQPFNEMGYALQTIDYALSHVQDESVLLDTNGSLNIGNFKAKTLDFHSTGLDAIAEDSEKLVIRDIPTNYYHPEVTLVVADFIRGRRDTIENALDAAVPVVEQRNEDGERLSVLSDYNNQKALHPDELLLFRQKGFVEAFGEDAERLAEALQVPLYERTVEGEKTSFVMVGMSDYMDLTENATINTHVAIPNVRDPRLDISQSISRMQEQIAIDPARQGFGAEIYRLDDGGYSISLVDYRSLHAISENINLSAEEAERYAGMTGPAAMSQRSDFVIEMANKYFGERLRLDQDYSRIRQDYGAAGILGTAILLDEPIELHLDNGDIERFTAYSVDEGYIMLYKSMEDAEQSFDPYMLSDLSTEQQNAILEGIDLSKDGVRQRILDKAAVDGALDPVVDQLMKQVRDGSAAVNRDNADGRYVLTVFDKDGSLGYERGFKEVTVGRDMSDEVFVGHDYDNRVSAVKVPGFVVEDLIQYASDRIALADKEQELIRLVGKGHDMAFSESVIINVDDFVARDLVEAVKIDEDGTITMIGRRVDEAGASASFTLRGYDEYDLNDLDKVLDAVKWDLSSERAIAPGLNAGEMQVFDQHLVRVKDALRNDNFDGVLSHELRGILFDNNVKDPANVRSYFAKLLGDINIQDSVGLREQFNHLNAVANGSLRELSWAIAYKATDDQIRQTIAFDSILDDNKDVLERLKNYPVEHQEVESYRISYGSDDRPGGIYGDIHVEMTADVPRVTLQDAQAIAESLGGEARMMNGHLWGDFTREDDARQFGDRVVALNVDRMVEEREASRNEKPAIAYSIKANEEYQALRYEIQFNEGVLNHISDDELNTRADSAGAVMVNKETKTYTFARYDLAENFGERMLALNASRLTDEEKLRAIGSPWVDRQRNDDGSYRIPTVDESLYWRYAAGIITVKEAAREFAGAGWTNFVDEKFTLQKFAELNEKHGKLTAEQLGLSSPQQQLLQQRFDAFKAEHGEEPLYAEVTIRFKDDGVQQMDMIKLSNDIDERDDDKVFFNVDGIEGLKDLLKSDNGEDFDIVDIEDTRFYAKSLYLGEDVSSDLSARIKAGTQEVRDLINGIGLDYSPLTPRLAVTANLSEDWREENHVFAHAMVTPDDILVFENREDAYDNKNGVSLSELPAAKQIEVLDVIKEHYGDDERMVSVLVDTQQVPEYALSAIVNGDFSGIEDADDAQNIRDFMSREAYKGALIIPRDEQPGFTTRPAFGPATDCVTTDILRTATIRQLREEHLAISRDLPFPEVEKQTIAEKTLENRRYNDEESADVKASVGAFLQDFVNSRFGNGDIHNTELQEAIKDYYVNSTNTAQDAAYDLAVRFLNKSDLNNPGILARNGITDVDAEAEKVAMEAVKAAEGKLPSFIDTIVLNADSAEDGVQLPLDENGEYEVRMLFRDGRADQIDEKGNYLPDGQGLSLDYPTVEVVKDDPYMQDKIEHTTNRYWENGSLRDQIYDIALHYGIASYGLSQQQDLADEPKLREAKGYLMDIISEALSEMGGHIEISHTQLPSVPIKGDWKDEGDGHPYMEVIKGDSNVRDAVFYDVHAEAYPIDDVISKLDFAETYALTVAVREAQIANLIGARESIQWNGLAVSHDADNQYAPQMFIDSVDVDQDGKVNIQGHYMAEDGKPITVEHGTFLELAGYDDLYSEVKTLMNIQDVTVSEDLSDGISFTADDQQLIKERMTSYLEGLDSDYYGTNINIVDRVSSSTIESWGDVHRLATSIGEDILRTADANDGELLTRYGIENISHEAQAIGQDTLAKAKEVLFNRDNKMFDQLDTTVAATSTMQKEYNTLRRASDSSYMFKDVVDSYSYERNPKDPQQVALLEVKGGYANYATSWLSVSDVLSKLNARQSELINEYPQLKEFASMEEKKQEAVQQPEAQEQQEKKRPFANIDYTKYAMPEGSTVEKANVFKQTTGKDAGKYAVSAIINGERKIRTLYFNDVTAFFNEKKGQDGAKATLDQLVAKYFGKSTAESMFIGSVGEAEKVRGEQEEAREQAADADKKEAEAQQEQKKQEEAKKEKKDAPSAALVQSEMLIAALVAAGADHGVWLNKDGKRNPDFVQHGQIVSPFNALMMNLHADANGYKTNQYMTFNDAKKAGVSVKKGETGLPFNWYNWDKYVSRINSNDIIDKEQYDALPAEEKDLYKALRTKEEKKIFNVDQTTMFSVAKPQYKELLEKEAKSVLGRGEKDVLVVGEGQNLYDEFKKDNPDTMLILRTGEDSFELYGADAEKAASILHIKLDQKDGEQAALVIPEKQLDNFLPKLVRDGQRVSVQNNLDKPEVLRRYGTADHIYKSVADLTEGLGKVAGDSLVISSIKNTGYDASKDLLIINDSRASVAGEEVRTAAERANDIYRAVAAYTGAADRLNRSGKDALPEDAVKYDKLVQEVAAGVLMARQGLPATISKENIDLIPYWERELKEDPKLIERLEGDVNNTVQAIAKLRKGETVDYAAVRGEKSIEAMKPKYYTIASQLATIPDMEKKQVVIVRDPANKVAAVILPSGASLEVNNEAPGLNKNRFVIALKKEGIEDVQFYNAGGALGLHQPNEFFADKTVEVAKLKQYEIQPIETINLKDEIARTSKVDIEQVSMIRDDDNKHVLYVKPAGGEAFTIYPNNDDIRAFFANLKDPAKFDAIRENLGQKYYAFVQRHPEFKANVLMPDINADLDISRITKVNIVKDKNKEKSYIMFATIDGESQKPREVSGVQAQRMWLVDDKDMYKLRLAAILFEDKLGLSEGQAAAQFRDNNEGQGVDNAPDAPEQEDVEEQQETRRGGFHR